MHSKPASRNLDKYYWTLAQLTQVALLCNHTRPLKQIRRLILRHCTLNFVLLEIHALGLQTFAINMYIRRARCATYYVGAYLLCPTQLQKMWLSGSNEILTGAGRRTNS